MVLEYYSLWSSKTGVCGWKSSLDPLRFRELNQSIHAHVFFWGVCSFQTYDRIVSQARLSELGQPYRHACQSLGDAMLALPLSQLAVVVWYTCMVKHV